MARDCGCDDDYFERSRRRSSANKPGAYMDPKEALYKATIMKQYRSLEFRRSIPDADLESQQVNRSCGDRIKLQFKTEQGIIVDAAYQGEGCSICIASAAMLCAAICGKDIHEAMGLSRDLIAMLETNDTEEARAYYTLIETRQNNPDNDLLSLWSVRSFGARIPCALLSWHILPPLLEKPLP